MCCVYGTYAGNGVLWGWEGGGFRYVGVGEVGFVIL